MLKKLITSFLLLALTGTSNLRALTNEELQVYLPKVGGSLIGRYEFSTERGVGRFQVRNARVNVTGTAVPDLVTYKAEVDLCAQGEIKAVDIWGRVNPVSTLNITLGQMREPFGLAVRRSPAAQYFCDQTFLAVQMGNARDVGCSVAWTSPGAVPVTLEGGVFNGATLEKQKAYWTKSYSFAFSASALAFSKKLKVISGVMKLKPEATMYLWELGSCYDDGRWHFEAEYVREWYAHHSFHPADGVDAFAIRRFPLNHGSKSLDILLRYDYMSGHSSGKYNADGALSTDNPARQRLTGGVTFALSRKKLAADIRLNYEQYFYHHGASPANGDTNKIVAELVCSF